MEAHESSPSLSLAARKTRAQQQHRHHQVHAIQQQQRLDARESASMSKNNGSGRRGTKKEQVHTTRALEYEIRANRHGVSANHLLNFSLPAREKPASHAKKPKKQAPTRTQNEFLHANFRFVIAPRAADATATPFWDMEALTEWTNVEQVLLWHDAASPMSCPICLDAYRAPKITQCGHIFCWPCILRYLSLSDKYWRRCPMCFESVQKKQLRSVALSQVALPPRIDASTTFQFLQRSKSSYFPHLRTLATTPNKRTQQLPRVDDAAALFARVLEATHAYVEAVVLAELRDLEALDAECRSSGDVDSLAFIAEAMRVSTSRLAESDAVGGQTTRTPLLTVATTDNLSNNSDVYSFYQLATGPYVVLHPLTMKCLLKEFAEPTTAAVANEQDDSSNVQALWTDAASSSSAGVHTTIADVPTGVRYDLLPETITGRVVDVEHVVLDDDMRKRYRFLSHLPRFCDLYLCELDVTHLLSPATRDAFKAELKKRERQRQRQQKSQRPRQHQASPVFGSYKQQRMGFAVEQGDSVAWPAPAAQTLVDAFDAQLVLHDQDDATDQRGRSDSRDSSDARASPLLNARDEGSFATITRQSGYYPPLSSSSSTASAFGADAYAFAYNSPPTSTAWGAAASPLVDFDLDALPRTKSKGGKKSKKGVALFSTAHHRSYR